MKIIER